MNRPLPLKTEGLPRAFVDLCRRYGLVTQRQALDAVESWLAAPERRPASFSASEAEALRIRLAEGLPAAEAAQPPGFQPPPPGVATDRPPPRGGSGRMSLDELLDGFKAPEAPGSDPRPDDDNHGGH